MDIYGAQNAGRTTNGPINTNFGSQMNAAWHNHKPADGNADIDTLARLGAIVEVVAHALQTSGDAISIEIPWRPTATVDLNLASYIALLDFHCRVMTSAHRDLPHAVRLPNPGGAAGRVSYTSFTPSGEQPD